MRRIDIAATVGKRVRVFWRDEDEWFAGRVQAADKRDGYFVVYDDGDERWEPPTQLVEFEGDAEEDNDDDERDTGEREHEDDGGGGDDEEVEQVTTQPRSSRAPQMLEPPASPTDDAYDDDDDDNEEENGAVGGGGATPCVVYSDCEESNKANNEEKEDDDEGLGRDADVYNREDSNSDELDEPREQQERSDSDDDGEQSIALSEVPITFERLRGRTNAGGKLVLVPPRAFVKIAFVEAGDSASTSASNLMLRCKNALASTSVAAPSCSPMWNELSGSDDEVDGGFHMQLVPPQAKAAPSTSSKQPLPPWLQLRGDILFSVYASAEREGSSNTVGGGRSGRQVHDFIGQAALSLPNILREALFVSPTLVRRLPLQSRQGRSLAPSRSSVEDGGDAAADAPEIVVSFEFEPTFSAEVRQRAKVSTPPSASTLTRPASARAQPKASSQQKAASKQAKRTHTSSSAVNRRRFAKQVDQQNVAFAKRVEWQHERRARLAEHAKAQAKSRFPVPQHGTMKRDHTASSRVNRSRFHEQVDGENRAMEKRLHAIALRSGGDSKRSRPDAKGYGAGFDDRDKDKLLAHDRREQRLCEHDFLQERAQATYRKQNAVVEEVLALQADVAELRAHVFAAKATASRLATANHKDEHLCKCLRSAAETPAPSTSSSGGSAQVGKRRKQRTPAEVDDGDGSSDADAARERKELQLLQTEAASLDADKQSRGQELAACNQRAQELDDEIHQLSAQLRFAQHKQAFQLRMSSKAGAAAQAMKQKAQRLELSRDDEEQWQLFQAHHELAQLQIAVQVLKEPRGSASQAASSASSATSTAACEYLERKIARQTQKLEQLETERRRSQREYEALVASGEQDALRRQVHELQQTLFLCQAQQKQLAAAQRHATLADAKLVMELQKQAFEQQTETDVLLQRRIYR